MADAVDVRTVCLVADQAVGAQLIRARVAGCTRAYAVLDQFGWAVVVPAENKPGRIVWSTVARFDPLGHVSVAAAGRAAVRGLVKYVSDGSEDE